MGFAVIDELAHRLNLSLRHSFRFSARLASGNIANCQVTLVKPDVFMNNSGPVVAKLAKRKNFSPEEMLVITDDADLPEGQLRIRPRGSSGGHKGLQSVINHLGHDNFARMRLGIGPCRDGAHDLVAHVLTPFPAELRKKMEKMAAQAAEAVVYLIQKGIDAAMNRFNNPKQQEIFP
jgi:PTH1 family peptidyl-tRNA hydrolase